MSDLTLHQDSDEQARRQLGDRLREARKYLGLKQEEVATYLKIPRTALTDIENGQRRVEAIELARLAKLYRQPVGYFTGEDAAASLPIDVAHLARKAADLSEQDRSELGRFAEYLRARSRSADYPSAVRAGTMAAARLHQQLDLRQQIEAAGGNVDVFAAIHALDLPLLVRPLQGLLGAYLSDPAPGVLITTQRPMSIQRFTAAHELGHFRLQHEPSLDDESILRRMPMQASPGGDFQEVEADAFAVEFMMPRWLVAWHAARQSWTVPDFRRPNVVYQLSLRIGASYEATCWTLAHHRFIQMVQARELLQTQPREMKAALLEAYRPQDYRGDVWLLTERDAGARIDGSRNDLFVLRLEEHSGGGYLWDIDQLKASGFAIVRDDLQALDTTGVGGPVIRRVTATPPDTYRGRLAIDERRPWDPYPPFATLAVEVDLTGPEQEGLSRAERRRLLEAA